MPTIPAQRRPMPRPQLVGTDVSLLDRHADAYAVAEVKWDGWRALLCARTGRLVSRHGTNLAPAFPDVLEAAAGLGDVVLDGELVCLTAGVPDFERVSARGVCSGPAAARRAVSDPCVYVVWDVLRRDDSCLMALPWTQRRAALEALGLTDDPSAGSIAMTTVYEDVPELLQATFDLGLEGIVAKQRDAVYRSGQRSTAWIKARHAYHRDAVGNNRARRRSA